MQTVSESVSLVMLFIALYFEVFLLITYFEIRKRVSVYLPPKLTKYYPSVTIIVPCWNEEGTIAKTIFSLLRLDYPRDKLDIIIVDDGSTDNTLKAVKRFAHNRQVRILSKENGGKHTAVNLALTHTKSGLVGCLDADSFVHPQALKRIVPHFDDPKMMAVTPAMKVHNASTVVELIQKVEYGLAIFLRQVLAYLDAQYVIPGPFSIVRTQVFHQIGFYRQAYNTEDMEMALRMQTHGYKIGNAPDALVYTVTPNTIKKLYKQRLRWTYGFLRNVFDYRHLFFNRQYGHLGAVILPAASFSIVSSIYVVFSIINKWAQGTLERIDEIRTVGLNFSWPAFELFFISTDAVVFLSIVAFSGTLFMVVLSRKLSEGHFKPGLDMLLFFSLYAFLAPLWMGKAVYNVFFARNVSWR